MAANGRKNADGVLAMALAAGATVADAAKQAGVSERTAHRRLRDPGFQMKVANTETAFLARTTKRLAEASLTAVTALEGLLLPGNPPAVRHAAAKSILDYTVRTQEAAAVREGLAALESRQALAERALREVVAELRTGSQARPAQGDQILCLGNDSQRSA